MLLNFLELFLFGLVLTLIGVELALEEVLAHLVGNVDLLHFFSKLVLVKGCDHLARGILSVLHYL